MADVVVMVYSTVWPGTPSLSFRMETPGMGSVEPALILRYNLRIRQVVAIRVIACRERHSTFVDKVHVCSYNCTYKYGGLPQV